MGCREGLIETGVVRHGRRVSKGECDSGSKMTLFFIFTCITIITQLAQPRRGRTVTRGSSHAGLCGVWFQMRTSILLPPGVYSPTPAIVSFSVDFWRSFTALFEVSSVSQTRNGRNKFYKSTRHHHRPAAIPTPALSFSFIKHGSRPWRFEQ